MPHGQWKALTFIAALRQDRIDAPWVINGPINGELFATYVDQVLAPTLAPGDIVILDNLARPPCAFPFAMRYCVICLFMSRRSFPRHCALTLDNPGE